MKQKNAVILIVLLAVLLSFTAYGAYTSAPEYAPPMQWYTTYANRLSGFMYAFGARTSDGGYIVCGDDQINPALWSSVIFKTDALGNVQWNLTLGGAHQFTLTDVYQTSDGGYIFAGVRNWAAFLVKISEKGVPEWNRTYGSFAFLAYVEQTADSGYILAAQCSVFVSLLKTDSDGNPEWNGTYQEGSPVFVHQTGDGGYVVAGQDQEGRLLLLKTNATGTMIWNQTYETPILYEYETSACATSTSDGGYIMAGVSSPGSFNPFTEKYPGSWNLELVKVDGNGTLVWQQTYGGDWDLGFLDISALSVQQTSDGGYIVAGTATGPSSNGYAEPVLLKMDEGGAVQWTKRNFGGSLSNGAFIFSVVPSSDGGYVFFGTSYGIPFIAKLAANPTFAPPSILFVSLFDAAGLELAAIVVLVVTVVTHKARRGV